MHYDDFRAMNSDIVIAAEGTPDDVMHGFAAVRKFITSEEARFTRFSEDSELAQLNRAAGTWFRASPQLFDVLLEARRLADETDGLFDPAILAELEHAGYDRSMDIIKVSGTTYQLSTRTHHAVDFRVMLFDTATRMVRFQRDMRIDLGGIAKGWIAEKATHVLSNFCTACVVNAGGDLFAIGTPAGETTWPVALEDPRDSTHVLAIVDVLPGAMATSSISKRRWTHNNHEQHHLIDPRTGLPAETDWLSVTVIAPSASVAEVFAKSLLIAGSREAQRIAARRDDVVYIAVDRNGLLWGSDRAKEFLHVVDETEQV